MGGRKTCCGLVGRREEVRRVVGVSQSVGIGVRRVRRNTFGGGGAGPPNVLSLSWHQPPRSVFTPRLLPSFLPIAFFLLPTLLALPPFLPSLTPSFPLAPFAFSAIFLSPPSNGPPRVFLSLFFIFPHSPPSLPSLPSLIRSLFLSLSPYLPPLPSPLSLRLFRRFFEGRSRGRQCKHRPSE